MVAYIAKNREREIIRKNTVKKRTMVWWVGGCGSSLP